MKGTMRLATLLAVAGLVVAACSSSGSTPAPSAAPSVAPSVGASVDPGSLLGKVLAAKKIVMSTDPQYPPQSELKPDGTYEGFDIDVGNEMPSGWGWHWSSRPRSGRSSPPARGAGAGTSASAR